MTTAPTGLWIGDGADVSLDIQDGGFFKITEAGRETIGTWDTASKTAMRVTLNGQTYDLNFRRRDLELDMNLPGSTTPTKFTQM